MNVPSNETIERVLDNSASRDEARMVAKWFSTIEGQRRLSDRISEDISRIERGELPLVEDVPSEEMYQRLMRHFNRKRKLRILYRVAAILLPCALVLGIGYKLDRQVGGLFTPMEYAEVYVPRGERMQMMFQDGTHVYINSESRIRYPKKFGLDRRVVELDGEAYFEVAHNTQRPFTVELDQAKIHVLGTKFNVDAHRADNLITVTLDEGKVNMEDTQQLYELAPSERLIYDKATRRGRLVKANDSRETSLWKHNVLSFRDASLTEVTRVLSRWYDVKFEIKNQAACKYFYTFTSENAPLDTILQEIERISPVSFVKNEDVLEVVVK